MSPSSPVPDALIASLAGRYALERELGRGGMATVYLARDLRHDRLVALKVIHADLTSGLFAERFVREIRAGAALQHPNLLPVFDSGEAGGRLFYTMPYIAGESLRDRLRRETQLPLEDALRITRESAEALAVVHQAGWIHRDIKPENILLSAGHAQVADLGVVRALGKVEGEESRLTGTGMALGTPAYMSPEQAAGSTELDARTDIYALGCVLYEMLTGEPPYTGPTAQAVIAKRFAGPPVSPRKLRPAVPEHLDRAIGRALSSIPADRYESMPAFAAALGAADSVAADAASSQTRRWRPSLVLVAVALAILAAAFPLSRVVRRGSSSPEAPLIAVLPFKNLGTESDAVFAEGLTEELTSRLAGLQGLGVISRTSADQYRNSAKSVRDIGRELGASYVLEGSVRWERMGDSIRIRVTPQLIDARTDRYLWTDQYDAALAEIFQVQGDIAQRVAAALDLTLLGAERTALGRRPTSNFDAYTLYLRAKAVKGTDAGSVQQRVELLERAVALDSLFALAHANLATIHLSLYGNFSDLSAARLARARQEAETALRLAPDAAETRIALGFLYWFVEENPDRAAEEFRRALRSQPSDPAVLSALGNIEASRGRWDEATRAWEHMVLLDPQSARAARTLVDAYRMQRDYPSARRYLDRALAIDDEDPELVLKGPLLELTLRGDTTAGLRLLRGAVTRFGYARLASSQSGGVLLYLPGPAYADSARSLTPAAFGGDGPLYHFWQLDAALTRGDSVRVRAEADSASVELGPDALSLPTMGIHARSVAAVLEAYRGRSHEARAHLAVLEREDPLAQDAYSGQWPAINVARAYAVIGERDSAVRWLKRLLKVPSEVTPAMLRSEPAWRPLIGYPAFERLLDTRAFVEPSD